MLKFVTLIIFLFSRLHAEVDCYDFKSELNKIIKNYLNELKKTEKIYASGQGGGILGEINLISIYWESSRIVNVSKARRLIVIAAEKLFKVLNDHKEIRPYLHCYPIGIESVDLHISFNNNIKDARQVHYVSLGNNKIHYYDFDLEILGSEEGETFLEASKIYHAQLLTKEKK